MSRMFHIRTLLLVSAAVLVAAPVFAQVRTYRTPTPLDAQADASVGEDACRENLACSEELEGGDDESGTDSNPDARPERLRTIQSSHIPADALEYDESDVHIDVWVDVDADDYIDDAHGDHHGDHQDNDNGRPHDGDRPRRKADR